MRFTLGLVVTGDNENETMMFKQVGKVESLRKLVKDAKLEENDKVFNCHVSMAHTRWATHGQPSTRNCHPHQSDAKNQFSVVHNGIITNYKDLKTLLENKGYSFMSETDTECAAILALYVYDQQMLSGTPISFTSLVKAVIKELVNYILC